MRFIQHYSGSKGNLYEIVNDAGRRLLIDPGVRFSMVLKALKYDLSNIAGCFCSHLHSDHCKSIHDVACCAGIDVYGSLETLDSCGLDGNRRANHIADKTLVCLNGFQVYAFETHHDCEGSLGFCILSDGEYLLFATDTSHISQRFTYPFSIIAIEASYDKDTLTARVESGDCNETLAKRLLTSHMERSETLRYIKQFCNLEKCREINLLHLSGENQIEASELIEQFEKELYITTRTVDDCSHISNS